MRPRAFSLVELVMVISIITVMAAVALPRFAGAAWRHRANSAARRIVADINYAQQRAKAGSSEVTITFNDKLHQYTLVGVVDIDRAADVYTVSLNEEPYRAKLVSIDIAGDTQITFDGYGAPASGGTITVSAGETQRTIKIDASTGKAAIQ